MQVPDEPTHDDLEDRLRFAEESYLATWRRACCDLERHQLTGDVPSLRTALRDFQRGLGAPVPPELLRLSRSGIARALLARYYLYNDLDDHKAALGTFAALGLPHEAWPNSEDAQLEYRRCLSAAALGFQDPAADLTLEDATGDLARELTDHAIALHKEAARRWTTAGDPRRAGIELARLSQLVAYQGSSAARREAVEALDAAEASLQAHPYDRAALDRARSAVLLRAPRDVSDLDLGVALLEVAAARFRALAPETRSHPVDRDYVTTPGYWAYVNARWTSAKSETQQHVFINAEEYDYEDLPADTQATPITSSAAPMLPADSAEHADELPRDILRELQESLVLLAAYSMMMEQPAAAPTRTRGLSALAEAIAVAEMRVLNASSQRAQQSLLESTTDVYQTLTRQYLAAATVEGDVEARSTLIMNAWESIARLKSRVTTHWYEQSSAWVQATRTDGHTFAELVQHLRAAKEQVAELEGRTDALERDDWDGKEVIVITIASMPETARLFDDLEAARQSLREQEDQIDDALPKLTADPAPDVEQIASTLRAMDPLETLVLDMYLFPDGLLTVFIITGEARYVFPIQLDPATLREMSTAFSANAVFEASVGETALQWLADELGEVLDVLSAPNGVGRRTETRAAPQLAIVPSGVLHNWPLWALPTPDGHRLIDWYACAVLPSADSLHRAAAHRWRGAGYVGLAPGPSEQSVLFATGQVASEASHLGGDAHTGKEATLARLTDSGAILSLVTHGHFDSAAPEASYVELADGRGGIARVGLMDLLAAGGPRSLLLLWACSAHGGVRVSDNWIGLSAAAITAAPTVLLTVCPVQEAAAAALSVNLVRELAGGPTVAQAVRLGLQALRTADCETAAGWGRVIADSLDATERAEFMRRWRNWLLPRCAGRPFGTLSVWAPFFVVGGLTQIET